ncbi:hypothetical protein [Novosphingobium sp. Gsoil 351]|uniref:hypothetical protein n=1 Tax=Novosphingobium sp. Gsoil 351 TaxID=2675225 RepID=UPI0012B4807C|nr:hypothetical protein [Novosphingobium sp. Gsoil 351]QGN54081.1 hypothetical protein GKE62_05515 [Novosphingobium sp. Gsoil 351]
MTSYKWLIIASPADFDQLGSSIDLEFQPARIAAQLKVAVTTAVCGILIEFEYIDKDYRSTYYNHYAKKGRQYRDDCVRLHFFEDCVAFDATRLILSCPGNNRLEDHYFGYIVLRPTIVATLGRSIVSPKMRQGARGRAIQSLHKVHLLGETLPVWGFPSMAQHIDISVCAHVSCWAILRHYSERYAAHRELLIHDITMLAKPFDPGGLTPAHGLNLLEAERIFQSAGTYPVIVGRKKAGEKSFYVQLLAYLESGFPLFIAMSGKKHAIVAAGYAWRPVAKAPTYAVSHAWEQVDILLAVDDNSLPYRCVPLKASTAKTGTPGSMTYSVADFDSFIVPLPEKVFYSAEAMERYSLALHKGLASTLSLPAENVLLRRYFITTISALRRYAREYESQFGDELVNILMRLKTAQFIWVVEYASYEQWKNGHIAGRAIIDATASPRDPTPVLFAHDENVGIRFDRSSAKPVADVMNLKRPLCTPLGRMEQNLRPANAKPK